MLDVERANTLWGHRRLARGPSERVRPFHIQHRERGQPELLIGPRLRTLVAGVRCPRGACPRRRSRTQRSGLDQWAMRLCCDEERQSCGNDISVVAVEGWGVQ